MSSVPYTERIEILNNSPFWADQVEVNESQRLTLSYASPEEERMTIANKASALTHMLEPQGEHVENMEANRYQPQDVSVENMDTHMSQPQVLETSSIPYLINQPVDPNLWDGSMYSISIFGLNKLLDTDVHNIAISLQRIVLYIRERPLGDKTEKDIPPIVGIGYTA